MINEPGSELNTSDFTKQLNAGCEKRMRAIRDLEGRMTRLQISEKAFTVFGIGSMVQELRILDSIFHFS
jgi:hypothetical protein